MRKFILQPNLIQKYFTKGRFWSMLCFLWCIYPINAAFSQCGPLPCPNAFTPPPVQWIVGENIKVNGLKIGCGVDSRGVSTDDSCNVIMAGCFGCPAENYVAKYNAYGNILWYKKYIGAAGSFEKAVADNNGNVIATGYIGRTTDMGNGTILTKTTGKASSLIAKYDRGGQLLWAKFLGEVSNTESSQPYYSANVSRNIITDENNNIIVFGIATEGARNLIFDSTTLPGSNTTPNIRHYYYVLKYDASGNLIWAKSLDITPNIYNLSSHGSVAGWSSNRGLDIDKSGNVVVAGGLTGNLYYNNTLLMTSNNNLAYTYTPDIFIIKFDKNGNLLWNKQVGSPGEELVTGMGVDDQNNIFTHSHSAYSNHIDFGNGFSFNLEPSYYYFGAEQPLSHFLNKYDSSGNLLWVKQLKVYGRYESGAYLVAKDLSVNRKTSQVYVNGIFGKSYTIGNKSVTGSIDFGDTTLYSPNNADYYIASYDGNKGKFLWAHRASGAVPANLIASMASDKTGSVLFSSWIHSGQTVSIGTKTFTHSPGRGEMFIARIGTDKGCCETSPLSLGKDTTLVGCPTYLLSAGVGHKKYLWSTNDTTHQILVKNTGTYSVRITTEAGCVFSDTVNITISPPTLQKWKWDFEAGSQPFSSEYRFKTPSPGCSNNARPPCPMVPEITYGIGTSPKNYHANFCVAGDHTTGSGNMMVVNGATNGNKRVWYTTLAIKPYTKYTISFWAMSLVSPIGFGFFANDAPLGDALTYNAAEKCKWKKHTYQWYSDNLSSVTFSLRNIIIVAGGNDIAFDDIEIEELPQGINLGADVFASCSHLLDAGAGFASYLWSNQDTTRTTRIDSTGTYWVKATTIDGCIFTDTIHVTINQPIATEIVWDFEGQDALFGSDLTLVPPTPACTSSSNCSLLKTEGKYAVASKIADYSHTWRCLTDHTKGGSGNFFFSNGDRTKTDKRWYANTAVQPYTEYEISFWMESINEGRLFVGVSMDNIPLGDTIRVASVNRTRTCQWKYYTFRWKSANQTQAELAIKSFAFATTKGVGNDIALDDIRIRTVPYFSLGEDIKVNCGYKLDAGAGYTSYLWSNNATSQSIQIDSTGTYWVEVTTNNLCRFRDSIYVCITNQDTLIVPHNTYYIDSVLAVSATTFSDKWLNDLNQIDGVGQVILDTLFVGASFANGKEGVWRPQANYAYVTNRGQSSPITTKVDGTFRLKLFRWEYEGELYTPEWRKVSTMTQYNPYNYDVENVDILQRYSAALYGYNGKLSTAVGANASYNELAFEGFEEYNANVNVNASNLTKSNFDLFTTNAVGNVNVHRWIPLRTGIGNTIASLLQTKLNTGRVSIKGVFIDTLQNGIKTFFLENQKIKKYKFSNQSCYSSATEPVCEVDSSGWTLITLDSVGTGFNYDFHQGRYWTGSIATDTLIQPESVVNANTVMISKTKAHTGKNSLKISADASFEQVRMDLQAGKEYVIGAWVSVEEARILDFASTGVGIEMKVGNDLISFQPKGEVIDGWQRIEGKFKVPTCGGKVHLKLKKGSNTVAYFDDMRLFPALGNMQSYVYDPQNYKLRAVLDNNNYATLYFYDAQGNLFLIKKETERGIQTIQESFSQQKINK
jgi:hypothetical protein